MPQRGPGEEDAARRAHLGVVALEEDRRAAVREHGVPTDHLEPRLLEHGRAVRLDHKLAGLGDARQLVPDTKGAAWCGLGSGSGSGSGSGLGLGLGLG